MSHPLTRRSALRGAGVVAVSAVAGFLLARRSDAAKDSGAGAGANGYGPAATGGTRLAPLTDVPDGGGLVLGDQHVVLVRDGTSVHGLSATCTHQGCTVGDVTGGVITCPCHGSQFDAGTGDVVRGPATQPLPPVPVEVRGGVVFATAGG